MYYYFYIPKPFSRINFFNKIKPIVLQNFLTNQSRYFIKTIMLIMSSNPYKEWLETSIQERSIHCYPENGIELDFPYIGLGGYGAVYKATIKQKSGIFSDMTVAVQWKYCIAMINLGLVKICTINWSKRLIFIFSLCLPCIHYINKLSAITLAKKPQRSE